MIQRWFGSWTFFIIECCRFFTVHGRATRRALISIGLARPVMPTISEAFLALVPLPYRIETQFRIGQRSIFPAACRLKRETPKGWKQSWRTFFVSLPRFGSSKGTG